MKNILLTTLVIFGLNTISIAQVPNYVPTNGLVGWWPFTGNANDLSVNNNNGTVNGATLTADRFSNVNSAYSFDGVNDLIDYGNTINILDNFSISFWINTSQVTTGTFPAGYGMVITKETSVSGNDWSSGIGNGRMKFKKGTTTATIYEVTSIQLVNNSTWKHIVILNSPTSVSIYINGVLDVTLVHPNLNFANSATKLINGFHDGTPFGPTAQYYSGKLDDIGIWNRALTACEITQLYTSALPTITTTTTASIICIGASTSITASGATTYTWMPGNLTGATITVSPTATTTYTVTGTNANGCVNTATRIITVNPLPVVTATSTAAAVCAGASVTLTGVGATSYSWSGGVTNAVSFIPTATVTYTVTGTNANGCVNTATITVTVNPLPVVTATSTSAAVCTGASVTLTGGGATTYTWDNNVTDAISFVPTATTTYMVTGTDANGCVNTAMTTVTVNPLPVVTASSSSAAVCTGGSVTLTGGGATTYTWDNNVTDAVSFVPTATTTYMVTGTDANGCVNTATTTLTVNALPTVTANTSSASVCTGGSVILTGGGAATYTWDNNVIDAVSFVPIATTTYMVIGTDLNSCMNTAMITVTVNPLPVVTATSSAASVCTGGSVTLTGGGAATYVWDNNVIDAVSFVPTATTTYMVTGTDANGCVNTATTTVTLNGLLTVSLGPDIIQCGGTALLDAGNIGSVYLWNNASTTQTITVSTSGTYIVDVTDVNGCMGSDTAVVTINTAPSVTATASSVVVCVDDATVSLTGTPTGGVWSGPGVTGSSLSPTAAGVGLHAAIYSYSDANGCEGIASINVQVNACVGFVENTLGNCVSVYPNPALNEINIQSKFNSINSNYFIYDQFGRVVLNGKILNTVTRVDLEKLSSGLYIFTMDTTDNFIFKFVKE